MRELRFDAGLYEPDAVREAVRTFEKFATLGLSESPDGAVVRIEARTPQRERTIAGELSNFALGLTVQKNRA